MNKIQQAISKIEKMTSIEGVRLRSRYWPRICVKCGVIPDFPIETNGLTACLTCPLPITKTREEISKDILTHIEKKLIDDGATIDWILESVAQ